MQLFLVWDISHAINSKALMLKQEYIKNIFRFKSKKIKNIEDQQKLWYSYKKVCIAFLFVFSRSIKMLFSTDCVKIYPFSIRIFPVGKAFLNSLFQYLSLLNKFFT